MARKCKYTPVSENDIVAPAASLSARICRGVEEHEQGSATAKAEGESMDAFLDRMIKE